MKKCLFFLIIIFLFICLTVYNEEYATTDKGKKVILHDNGTWEYYVEKKAKIKEEKKEEKPEYIKSENSKSEIKGSRKAYNIWYDNGKWTVSKAKSNDKNIEYKYCNILPFLATSYACYCKFIIWYACITCENNGILRSVFCTFLIIRHIVERG